MKKIKASIRIISVVIVSLVLTSCFYTDGDNISKGKPPILQYKLELRDENNNHYNSNELPLDFYNNEHIFSFTNFNRIDLDISIFVLVNGKVVPFTSGDSDSYLFVNAFIPAETQVNYTISLDVEIEMLKYKKNQLDIITVINSDRDNIDVLPLDDFFVGNCRFYLINENSQEDMSCPLVDKYISSKTAKQKELLQGRGGYITRLENMDDLSLTATINGEFGLTFCVKEDGIYSYFLVEQNKGVLTDDAEESNLVYLRADELFQKKYFMTHYKKNCIYFAVIVPLFVEDSLAFSTQRVLNV